MNFCCHVVVVKAVTWPRRVRHLGLKKDAWCIQRLATSENQDYERYLTVLLNMTESSNNLQAVTYVQHCGISVIVFYGNLLAIYRTEVIKFVPSCFSSWYILLSAVFCVLISCYWFNVLKSKYWIFCQHIPLLLLKATITIQNVLKMFRTSRAKKRAFHRRFTIPCDR